MPEYKTVDRALTIASDLFEKGGFCTHYPGYTCDNDFTTPGVCGKCIRHWLLAKAREELRDERLFVASVAPE